MGGEWNTKRHWRLIFLTNALFIGNMVLRLTFDASWVLALGWVMWWAGLLIFLYVMWRAFWFVKMQKAEKRMKR